MSKENHNNHVASTHHNHLNLQISNEHHSRSRDPHDISTSVERAKMLRPGNNSPPKSLPHVDMRDMKDFDELQAYL